jgi:hypothetical protein
MTFEEGSGDEFLLTCFVCKNPFGLVAQFCGYCQATRQQALGVERAKPNQQILLVQESQQNFAPPIQQPPVQQQRQPQSQPGVFTPQQPKFSPPQQPKFSPPQQPKPRPQKVQQPSVFRENAQLRSKNFGVWQKKNSKKLVLLGTVAFLLSTYFTTQSIIFLTNSPNNVAEDRLYLGASRSTSYFDNFPENSGFRFFPAKFSTWPDSDSQKWTSSSSWNGWKGSATVNFLAAGSDVSGIPITGEFKAKYSSTLGIFRKVTWVAKAPAILNIDYPNVSGVSIYINGIAAGTTSRPSVSPGQYQMYPGSFTVNFYDLSSGEELTAYERYYFIDAQGSYDMNFN